MGAHTGQQGMKNQPPSHRTHHTHHTHQAAGQEEPAALRDEGSGDASGVPNAVDHEDVTEEELHQGHAGGESEQRMTD